MNAWVARTQSQRVAVLAGARTPFAKAGTELKECSAVHLGIAVAAEAMARSEIGTDEVDEVVFGNAGTPADAANISRVIALRAGIPEGTPAFTVHRNCASAMEAVAQGCMKIGAGLADTMLVGGTESMSQMPLIYGDDMKELFTALTYAKTSADKLKAVSHFRPTMLKPVVAIMEGLTDPVSGLNMGQTAELLARDFKIPRDEQDRFALRSHQRAVEAQRSGKFAEEIVPVILEPDFSNFLDKDIGPRESQTIEQLGKLRPFFDRENGTVTPGNACPITDGAGAVVLMNESKAKSAGRKLLGKITGFAFSGCEPKRMGMGPTYSTAVLLDAMGMDLKDVELIELNEAFSAQVIANQRAFGSKTYCQEKLGRSKELGELRDDVLNVNGGAVALGHPVGATGVRLILTCLYEMQRRNVHRGLATLCIGGGQGAAFMLERE